MSTVRGWLFTIPARTLFIVQSVSQPVRLWEETPRPRARVISLSRRRVPCPCVDRRGRWWGVVKTGRRSRRITEADNEDARDEWGWKGWADSKGKFTVRECLFLYACAVLSSYPFSCAVLIMGIPLLKRRSRSSLLQPLRGLTLNRAFEP